MFLISSGEAMMIYAEFMIYTEFKQLILDITEKSRIANAFEHVVTEEI